MRLKHIVWWLVSVSISVAFVACESDIYWCSSDSNPSYWTFRATSNCSTKVGNDEKLSRYPIKVSLFAKSREWINFTSVFCQLRYVKILAGKGHSGQIHLENITLPLDRPLNISECNAMIKNKECRYGPMMEMRGVLHKLDDQIFSPHNWFWAPFAGTRDYYIKECLAFSNHASRYNTQTGEIYLPGYDLSGCNASVISGGCEMNDRTVLSFSTDLSYTSMSKFDEVLTNREAYYVGKKSIFIASEQMTLDVTNSRYKNFDSDLFSTLQGFLVECSNFETGDSIDCIRPYKLNWRDNSDESMEIGDAKSAQSAARLRTLQAEAQRQFESTHQSICTLTNTVNSLRKQFASTHPYESMVAIFGTRALTVSHQAGVFAISFCSTLSKESIMFVPDNACTGMIAAFSNDFNTTIFIEPKNGRAHLNIGPVSKDHKVCKMSIQFLFYGKTLLYDPTTGQTMEIKPKSLPVDDETPVTFSPNLVKYMKPLGHDDIDPIRFFQEQIAFAKNRSRLGLPHIDSHPQSQEKPSPTVWQWIGTHPVFTSVTSLFLLLLIVYSVLACAGKVWTVLTFLKFLRDLYKVVTNFREQVVAPN